MYPFPYVDTEKLAKTPFKIGRLADRPAGWIDLMEIKESSGFLTTVMREIRQRFIYLTIFPTYLVADISYNLAASLINVCKIMVTTDDYQKKNFDELEEHSSTFSRSLLALSASFIGLVKPKWITYFFNPDRNHPDFAHSGGDINHQKIKIHYPDSVKEIQAIVKKAIAENKAVCIRGAGFSQGEQYLGGKEKEAILIDLAKLNHFKINEEDKTISAEAGCRWAEMQTALNQKKLALRIMQASNIFRATGSFSTNIHGWDYHSGMLSKIVDSIEVINGHGDLITLTPEDEQFNAISSGFGLCGIITKIHFKVQDNIPVQGKAAIIPPEEFVEYFDKNLADNPKVKLFRYRLSISPKNLLNDGIVSFYEVIDEKPQPIVSENFRQEGPIGTRSDRIFANAGKHWDFIREKYWDNEVATLPNEQKETSINAVMQPEMNAMFSNANSESEWLQEYFLPKETLTEFLNDLAKTLKKNNVPMINCSVRFVKGNKAPILSYAPEDRFAVVICFNQLLKDSEIQKTAKWINEVTQNAIDKGGSYYLPYQQLTKIDLFNQAYGKQAKIFKEAKEKYDPHGVFHTGFYEKYILQNKFMNRLDYKALLEKDNWSIFENFVGAVLKRLDTNKFKAVLEDVCQHCNNEDDIYQELLRRFSEFESNPLADLSNGLNALSAINQELTEQAIQLVGEKKAINGYLEIGYPGRYIKSFNHAFKMTGKSYALHHQQSMMDYIEAGLPRPYHQFLKLDDLNPEKALSTMPSNSVEMISCFYGLHHFPEEKLAPFLRELRRVLKPNGILLLDDHDVIDEQSTLIAHAAHTMVNLINKEPLAVEQNELRHFKPMQKWQQILAKYNLASDENSQLLIRDNDASRNAMMAFTNQKGKSITENPYCLMATSEEQVFVKRTPSPRSPLVAR